MLNDGKAGWVEAMLRADRDFMASYGATLGENDPEVIERLRNKYEDQFDAMSDLLRTYAVIGPANMNVVSVTGIANLTTGIVTLNPPGSVTGNGVIE